MHLNPAPVKVFLKQREGLCMYLPHRHFIYFCLLNCVLSYNVGITLCNTNDKYGDEKPYCSSECDSDSVSSELATFDTMSTKSIDIRLGLLIISSTDKFDFLGQEKATSVGFFVFFSSVKYHTHLQKNYKKHIKSYSEKEYYFGMR